MSYKHELILFCKSYRNDIDRAKILFDSIQKHNVDKLPFYFSIPKADLPLFESKLGATGYEVVFDEDLTSLVNTQSHFNQQLFKMEFYKTQIAKYFFLVDSDMYFIRDFSSTDFVTEDGIPYMTMHECKDVLEYSPFIFGDDRMKDWFDSERLAIMELFNRKGKPYDYSGSANLYISSVFEGLFENYCKPNNLTFLDLLKFKSSENTWYGEYALFSGLKFYPCAPMFKTFHYKLQYDICKSLGLTEQSISKNYLGITMQSNWNSPLKY
jgi:hypothetical protein